MRKPLNGRRADFLGHSVANVFAFERPPAQAVHHFTQW
jgi:hypothetical protein